MAPQAISPHELWPNSLYFGGEHLGDDQSDADSSRRHTVAPLFDETRHHNCVAFSQAYICSRTNNIDSVGSLMGFCQLYAAFLHSHILDISSPYFTHLFATPSYLLGIFNSVGWV